LIDTILFDLDGTLLPVDTDKMIDEYFISLTKKLSNLFEPDFLFKSLYSASMDMINNLDPDKTNQQVFFESFLKKINYPEDKLIEIFNEFYLNDYKKLGKNVKSNDFVKRSLDILIKKGYDLILATNPVFPEIAVLERLRWIGIDKSYFSYITTYENMHFCKPYIQYYEEIINKLGKDPKKCYMVGNDIDEDLTAQKLGLKTFLIEDYIINRKSKEIVSTRRGSFEDFYNFVLEIPNLK